MKLPSSCPVSGRVQEMGCRAKCVARVAYASGDVIAFGRGNVKSFISVWFG